MAEVGAFITNLIEIYKSSLNILPPFLASFINLFLLVLFIAVYSIFIWEVHRFISKKNILELNLNQYNRYEHPFLAKLVAGFFYFIEYIIILPFLIFFWFSVFTSFLIFLSEEGVTVSSILIISAVIISSIRMTAYYNEDLSRELAKLLPFTLMAFFIVNFGVFNFQRVIEHITKIPDFLDNIIIYLGFIISLEIILRFFSFIFSLFGLEENNEEN